MEKIAKVRKRRSKGTRRFSAEQRLKLGKAYKTYKYQKKPEKRDLMQ